MIYYPVRHPFRMACAILTIAVIAAACGNADSNESEPTLTVVATTTIWGDVAHNIVGDHGTVEVLFPIGANPHDYQASSQQIASIQEADLVIANGLFLEEGLLDVLKTAAADGANVLEIGEYLDPIPFGFDNGSGEDIHRGDDPHLWLDPQRLATATQIIAAELAAIDSSVDWSARADNYAAELLAADKEITEILSAIPESDRKLVANHAALGYFAARYGFVVIGTVIPGGSTLGDPSSVELASLVEKIKTENVSAIFAETIEPAALAEAVAAEVGDTVTVVDLYTGSLGEPGSGAETLIGMLVINARLIAEALS